MALTPFLPQSLHWLALQLLLSAALLALIGRGLPQRPALLQWAAALVALAAAALARAPWAAVPGLGAAADLALVLASGLCLVGLQCHLGRLSWPWRLWGGLGLMLGLVLVLMSVWGIGLAPLALNGSLAALSGCCAWLAWRDRAHLGSASRAPLMLLAGLLGAQAVWAGCRAVGAVMAGVSMALDCAAWGALGGSVGEFVLALLLPLLMLWLVFAKLGTELAELTHRDGLTCLLNRAGLAEALARHFASRAPQPMCVLMVDLDHFKRLNAELGHAAGDLALQALAACLQSGVRAGDLVARVGGEEFLVGCVDADQGEALVLAERLRAAVQALQVVLKERLPPLRCTVSIGVSQPFLSREQGAIAMAAAEQALYAAKAAGRNRVEPAR